MEKTVTATEAVRDFSGLLNTIKFKGDSYIIKRGGKPVACIGPIREAKSLRTLKELKGIIHDLPKIGDDLDSFERDLMEIWKTQLRLPEEDIWE